MKESKAGSEVGFLLLKRLGFSLFTADFLKAENIMDGNYVFHKLYFVSELCTVIYMINEHSSSDIFTVVTKL